MYTLMSCSNYWIGYHWWQEFWFGVGSRCNNPGFIYPADAGELLAGTAYEYQIKYGAITQLIYMPAIRIRLCFRITGSIGTPGMIAPGSNLVQ
jgi:hypothetical protein